MGLDLSKPLVPEVTHAQIDVHARLLELLRHSGPLIIALVHVTPTHLYDDMCDLLLKVFSKPASTEALLKHLIEFEVASTTVEGTLFRGNSLTTRLLTVYARREGLQWLMKSLEILIDDVRQTTFYGFVSATFSLRHS